MSWLSVQTKGTGVTKTALARAIGVSRPTLNKIEENPALLNLHQMRVMQKLGFTVPGNEIISSDEYEPTICCTCGGSGIVYRHKAQSLKQSAVKHSEAGELNG